MLPKQLKDSQRHQRQPKQVELFLQRSTSGKRGLVLEKPRLLWVIFILPKNIWHSGLLQVSLGVFECLWLSLVIFGYL